MQLRMDLTVQGQSLSLEEALKAYTDPEEIYTFGRCIYPSKNKYITFREPDPIPVGAPNF